MPPNPRPHRYPGEPVDLWQPRFPVARDETRPLAERLRIAERGIILRTEARTELAAELKSFVERPWSPHDTWRGLLLIGHVQDGRSSLVRQAFDITARPRDGEVLMLRAPPNGKAAFVWSDIIGRKRLRLPSWSKQDDRQYAAIQSLSGHAAIVIDNGEDILNASPGARSLFLAK